MNRIEIISTVGAQVLLDVPELRLKRVWPKKGAKQKINFEDLEEAIYYPGVENLFTSGVLYIEDMATKIALGLESEESTQPTNIIVLTEAQQKRYLTVAPVFELKEVLEKLSTLQAKELAQYAIALEITDLAKTDLLKEYSGVDVIKNITLLREE